MTKLPTVFVSHGSPMLTLEPQHAAHQFLRQAASHWSRPKAILAVSAHWETAEPEISATARPETIHDFYGFPPALYQMRYPAAGAPDLAARIKTLLDQAGFRSTLDPERGLDHGAWSPLTLIYPDAGIPVLQLSLQSQLGPAHHVALGRALAPLRDEGVLIFASGSLTHNLRLLDWRGQSGVMPWAQEFADWMHDRLTSRDDAALIDYRRQAPHAVAAHPTDEHLLPIFVALGAATPEKPAERLHASFTMGSLAMDSYLFA
ncbi:class III extradiol ring-cleavage dioxygenase [uncultured Ferrovibrio sp.]|jgi:4,5-DOPA dioxygenase extradiol|uniref:DODA-type extradiol aromatic ring-opening family dioxygenase n=1 Tax=uncultured Ferrovibrio sp. TaxID=1576913 RepID=UPI00260D8A81|nr:class III extradiol ring-cleavage dioxygenase [uncultured Ferrovibrio sp.]